jgi:hypothetical protein
MISRYTVIRNATLEGETLNFMVFLGSRKRGWRTFRPEEVPPFMGKEAVFEVDIVKGIWTFVRQVAAT